MAFTEVGASFKNRQSVKTHDLSSDSESEVERRFSDSETNSNHDSPRSSGVNINHQESVVPPGVRISHWQRNNTWRGSEYRSDSEDSENEININTMKKVKDDDDEFLVER